MYETSIDISNMTMHELFFSFSLCSCVLVIDNNYQ